MRILLVDDEASVLQTLMAILKTIPGHEVRVAANSQKAHEHAANMGGLDLLISDVVMEPTDGFTMRAELQAMYPKMRTIFVSGYDLSDYSHQLDGAHVVSKPVDAALLRGLVENNVQQMVDAATAHHAAGRPPTATAAPAPMRATVVVPQPTAGIPSSAPRPAYQAPAVAQPQAVAQPRAVAPQPVAQPQAVAPPRVAAPQPAAAPQGMPGMPPVQAMPQARAMPQAVSASQPRAIASGVRAVAVPATAGSSSDPLIGVQLGDYRVQQFLGKGVWGSTYLAIQLSVNRPVGLKVMDLANAHDENARHHFLADARAKAAVQHPFIVSVFEADERNGLVFYTHEFLDGATLEDLAQQGQQFDEKITLHVLKVAGEGLNYLWSHNLAHSTIDAKCIRMGKDGIARLANLATSRPDPDITAEYEIQTVAGLIAPLIAPAVQSVGLRALLSRMAGGANAITAWPAVLQAVKALEPKVVPIEAAKIKAADAAAQRAVEAARIAQKRSLIVQLGTLAGLLLAVAFVVWKFVLSNKRDLTQKIAIPEGNYTVGPLSDSRTINLGPFDIDKYEVTIGDYAEFIAFCEANPDKEHNYDHERSTQRQTSHANPDVMTLIGRARKGTEVFIREGEGGIAVDLNCPMVAVTYWDAYAYAKWRGRDLPTEEEWEVAARGPKGNKYPWGDDLVLKNFNSNPSYAAMKPTQSTEDGYNYWAPVDKFSRDESPFKVVGMAGNVAEWVYRKEGAKEIPVVKGGSFATPPIPMSDRLTNLLAEDCRYILPAASKKKAMPGSNEFSYVGDPIMPSTRCLYIGFRTVKRK